MLGKAREIADASGSRVLAICSKSNQNPERLISFGSDHVTRYEAKSLSDWVRVLHVLLDQEKDAIDKIFLPSNRFCDLLLGQISSHERVGCIFNGGELLPDQSTVTKLVHNDLEFTSRAVDNKTSIWSLRVDKFPEPFEDSSRDGKTTDALASGSGNQESNTIAITDSSLQIDPKSQLFLLVERNCLNRKQGLPGSIHSFARRYNAIVMESFPRVVYGPCIALEVSSSLESLPEFLGDQLIAINSRENPPIWRIATTKVKVDDIPALMERLALAPS